MKWLLLAISACVCSCASNERRPVSHNLSATVTKATLLPSLPSGSAMQVIHDSVYIISDDAPYIFRTTVNGVMQDSIRLQHLRGAPHRIAKPVKPDFEAAVGAAINGRDCIVAFGSGSMRPQRDSAIIVPVSSDTARQFVVSVAVLYMAMRQQAGISESDFNIEAAALYDDRLVLFNRGTNHVFVMGWQVTLKHLLEGATIPKMTSHVVELPPVNNFRPGFSGACFLDAHRILFCASIEDTKDWVADGEVMGSYVGVLELPGSHHPNLLAITPMLDESGKVIKEKLEGVYTYEPADGNGFNVLGIVDNDDGTSRLLHIYLKNVPAL